MKRLTDEIRNNIICLLDSGLSSHQIEAQIGVSRRTVDAIRAQTRPAIQKSIGGWPAKLTAVNKRWMVRNIMSGQTDNATQLTQKLRNNAQLDVSTETVRRALKESGLKAAVKPKKPRLLPRHKKARFDFAIRYQHWTINDWKRIVWSDETKINRLGCDGREWIWKKPNSMLTAQHVKGTVKFGGGSLFIWGCITAQGTGYATRIDGGMDAELYTKILDDELLQTLKLFKLDKKKIIFQQDGDSKHTSKAATQWFKNNNIEVLPWPAQSPDLNPMEHLWWYLKRQLASYETEPISMHQLWERVEVEWDKIPAQVCIDLVESMPSRIAAVLKAKGGYTKY
jgi:transposase